MQVVSSQYIYSILYCILTPHSRTPEQKTQFNSWIEYIKRWEGGGGVGTQPANTILYKWFFTHTVLPLFFKLSLSPHRSHSLIHFRLLLRIIVEALLYFTYTAIPPPPPPPESLRVLPDSNPLQRPQSGYTLFFRSNHAARTWLRCVVWVESFWSGPAPGFFLSRKQIWLRLRT